MFDYSNSVLVSLSNKQYKLTNMIAQGAQGAIYNEASNEKLIKIYHTKNKNQVETIINKLQYLQRIDLPARFIQPEDIICMKNFEGNVECVGYAMKRVKGHMSLNKFLIPPDSEKMRFREWYNEYAGGLRKRLYIAYLIAQSFYILHRDNRTYCDISGNNILVSSNPDIYSVCMIDIDNIYVSGKESSGVLGTLRYMAPEISNKQLQPDILTDDYSLAVIIFELLRAGHPYVGDFIEESSPEVENSAYLGMFPYVDDEKDTSNASSHMLPADAVFNHDLKKLFYRTFVEGKENRMKRATAHQLAVACLEEFNALIRCDNCGTWYLPNDGNIKKGCECQWCNEINYIPPCLFIGDRRPKIDQDLLERGNVFNWDKVIFLHSNIPEKVIYVTNNYLYNEISFKRDIEKEKDNIAYTLKCAVDNENTCHIKNVSNNAIFYVDPKSKKYIPVPPGQIAKLTDGCCIYLENDNSWKNKVNSEDVSNWDAKNVRTKRIIWYRANKRG